MEDQRTLVVLKPDAVRRGLVGEIILRLEKRGLRLCGARLFRFDEALCREHYAHLAQESFFSEIVDYMTSGPSLALIWEGPEAVRIVRTIIGPTNPVEAPPGTIRGDFAISYRQNVVHASDSLETATEEIERFFPPECSLAPLGEV